MRLFLSRGFLLLPFLLTGCVSSTAWQSRQDQLIQESNARAASRALEVSGTSVVFFQVENPNPRRNQSRVINFAGLVLTEEGHILAPFTIRKDSNTRIEAWVEQRRYLARPVMHDEGLGMSILKIDPVAPLTPFDWSEPSFLPLGATAYATLSTDEDREFEPFVFQAVCQGIVQGRYRQYSLSSMPDLAKGAPLFDRMGNWVGIAAKTHGWVAEDLVLDLEDLIDRALGENGSEGEDEPEEAWFGSILSPINSDYARATGLPASSLWLSHVFEDGSAYQAGLRTGDLLIEVNDTPLRLRGRRAYRYFLQTLRAREGQPFTATVIREGKEVKVQGVILERPDPDTFRAEDLGITITDIHESMVIRNNLFTRNGVMVTNIKSGSPAATGRTFGEPLLRETDVITALGGKPTPNVEAFADVLEEIRKEKPDTLLVEFQRGAFTGIEALNLRIGEENNGGTR